MRLLSVKISDHGMQVFDLTRLRDVSNPPEILKKMLIIRNLEVSQHCYK